MLSTTLLTVAALAAGANAHFRLLAPTWRGSSFEEPASQWIYPCANVNETTDMANRTHPIPLSSPQHPAYPSQTPPKPLPYLQIPQFPPSNPLTHPQEPSGPPPAAPP